MLEQFLLPLILLIDVVFFDLSLKMFESFEQLIVGLTECGLQVVVFVHHGTYLSTKHLVFLLILLGMIIASLASLGLQILLLMLCTDLILEVSDLFF